MKAVEAMTPFKPFKAFIALSVAAFLGVVTPQAFATTTAVLLNAHSHNDFEHPRPLMDAIERKFGSIEADVFLVDGKLLVGHDAADLQPTRTLEALYLDPLRAMAKRNRGHIYEGTSEPLQLLVDAKTTASETYDALRKVLSGYNDVLTQYGDSASTVGAVAVVLSGNRPSAPDLQNEAVRYVALDGRLNELKSNPSPKLVPLVSAKWDSLFKWTGEGNMPEAEAKKLSNVVSKMHREGRKLRFWATPEKPAVWQELQSAGVDYIGSDNLEALQAFLSAKK